LFSGGTWTEISGTFFGIITMKMISNTRHTSTSGVTLISLSEPRLRPRLRLRLDPPAAKASLAESPMA
jgi:hypothetical protein